MLATQQSFKGPIPYPLTKNVPLHKLPLKNDAPLTYLTQYEKEGSRPFVLIILSIPFLIVMSVNGTLSCLMLSVNLALIFSKSPF